MEAITSAEHSPAWTKLGLQFNPFTYLDAAEDPNLPRYLIQDEGSRLAVNGTPAFIFAPPGGGKTALRVSALRSCWSTPEIYHSFPVQYVLHQRFDPRQSPPSSHEHRAKLIEAIGSDLLLSLGYRPELFLALPLAQQRELARLIQAALPWPIAHCLSTMSRPNGVWELSASMDRGYWLPDPPAADDLRALRRALESALATTPSIRVELDDLLFALTHFLPFRQVIILVDGVDGFLNTHDNAPQAYAWIAELLALASEWRERKVNLQGFLPSKLEDLVSGDPYVAGARYRIERLTWSSARLEEVLQRRVWIASGQQFESLDWVAAPDLEDVERQIVESVAPLPREAIFLADKLLRAFAARAGQKKDKLRRADLLGAIQHYRASAPHANVHRTSQLRRNA